MKTVFLAGAEEDLKELRQHIIKSFGKPTWRETHQKLRESIRIIQTFPESGSIPAELADLGMWQYRQVICGMNRLIYETGTDVIYIHIVCDTRRDLRTLLSRRLVRVTTITNRAPGHRPRPGARDQADEDAQPLSSPSHL